MSDREQDVAELLSQLSRTEPLRRDELAERGRRSHVARVMHERLVELDARRVPTERFRWGWRAAAAAAVALLGFGGARWLTQFPTPSVEAERHPIPARDGSPRALDSNSTPAGRQADFAAPPPSDARGAARPAMTDGAATRPHPRPEEASRAVGDPKPERAVEPAPSASALTSSGETSLSEQNKRFQAAVRAIRRGDDHAALAEFDALLARYPNSVLAADARVRRFRVLARLGRDAEARAGAEQYLRHHSGGFAEAEAKKLVSASGGKTKPGP